MDKQIYIADDEKNIRNLIKAFLEKEGYQVQAFENGDLLFNQFIKTPCDLVILDVMMPGSSGLLICTKLRELSNIPILMLTARDTDEDYISGISLGSDDYFTKPFSPIKLIMRVKAMFRRISMDTSSLANKADDDITIADLHLDAQKLQAYVKNKELHLTGTEFNMLKYLCKNHNRAISREELLNKIWGFDSAVETRATDAAVKRLRKKLLDAKSDVVIDTVWGHGFRIR